MSFNFNSLFPRSFPKSFCWPIFKTPCLCAPFNFAQLTFLRHLSDSHTHLAHSNPLPSWGFQTRDGHPSPQWQCWGLAMITKPAGGWPGGASNPACPNHTFWTYISCHRLRVVWSGAGYFMMPTYKGGKQLFPLGAYADGDLSTSSVRCTNKTGIKSLKESGCGSWPTDTVRTFPSNQWGKNPSFLRNMFLLLITFTFLLFIMS